MLPAIAFLLATQPANDLERAVKALAHVFATVEAEAADPVNTAQAMYAGAIPGMLRVLDPHSIFLDPDQYQQLQEMSASEQKGFGSIVSILPGRVFILQTLPDTPSARAGLSPGDEIVAVNGIALMGLEPDQLVYLLSQSRRQQAAIIVRRANTPRLLEFQLTPATVATESVDRVYFLQPGIGYIRIANFDSKTGRAFHSAIEKLGGANLQGLVLDLRNNPGGVAESALEAASLFLEPGQTILRIRGRSRQEETVAVPQGVVPYRFPVSVLINEKTASGAEIVAAALQDHGRAKVVGAPSFGKGLVQSVYPLADNTALALTVAFYFSPNGRNIQRPLKDVQLATDQKDRGGVLPDAAVGGETLTRLRGFLDATGAFTTFASEALRKGNPLDADAAMPSTVMDDFRIWLSERSVQPSISEWSADASWIRNRLHQELVNQSIGVEKGDEIEARRDPQVQRAIDFLRQPL
jgi:carboxyl-terminal processing protease